TDAGATSGPTYQSGEERKSVVQGEGETWTYSATYQINQADLNSGSYNNEATGSAQADLNGDGTYEQTVNDNAEVTVIADLTPAIELNKTLNPAGQSFDAVGDIITYQLTLVNTGNAPLFNPQVTDAGATSGPTYQSG